MTRIEFTVPDGYQRIPIGLSLPEAQDQIEVRLKEAAAPPTTSVKKEMANNLHAFSRALELSGTLFAGVYLHGVGDGLDFGALLVGTHPLSFPDSKTAVMAISAAAGQQVGGGITRSVFELPCGPAVVLAHQELQEISAEFTPTSEPVSVEMSMFRVIVPISQKVDNSGEHVAVINLQFLGSQNFQLFSEHLASLMRSFIFRPDSEES
ncbi:hypothetical protein [Streptomyces boninensis]|uniref:hypothetical protein n=1 Tax=Streptomyces boninensis TaxID=2039455 RepID=UPI003B2104E5